MGAAVAHPAPGEPGLWEGAGGRRHPALGVDSEDLWMRQKVWARVLCSFCDHSVSRFFLPCLGPLALTSSLVAPQPPVEETQAFSLARWVRDRAASSESTWGFPGHYGCALLPCGPQAELWGWPPG